MTTPTSSITPTEAAPAALAPAALARSKPPLTAEQRAALAHLHKVAQQFESLFVNMLFKSMRAASPQTSITGAPLSPAETTFTEMLDAKQSEKMAETGAFGIGKILEKQLRDSVLANPSGAAKARLAPDGIL
jgi:flagellar protein FlgJ